MERCECWWNLRFQFWPTGQEKKGTNKYLALGMSTCHALSGPPVLFLPNQQGLIR